jgi:hypothetical protein
MFLHIYLLIKICKKVCIRNKNLANLGMQSKPQNSNQLGFYSTYEEQLNHQHPLFRLSQETDNMSAKIGGTWAGTDDLKQVIAMMQMEILKH